MVRIGIVGAGKICQGPHMGAYDKIDNVEIVSICDINENRLEEAKKRYPNGGEFRFSHETGPNETQWVIDNLPGVAKNFDTIVICVSSDRHEKIANSLKALNKKVIVLSLVHPSTIKSLSWVDTILMGYSASEYTLKALLGVLSGEFEPIGTVPFN